MTEASKTFEQMTLLDTDNAISSPASESGPTHSDKQAGQTIDRSGQDRVPASHSARPASGTPSTTLGTYGLIGLDSSPSERLASSLVNRLRPLTDTLGSTLFSMTWNLCATPSRRLFYLLRASALRTDDTEYTSWPTPVANDDNKSVEAHLAMKARMGGGRKAITSLKVMAQLCAWNTPTSPVITNGHQAGNNRYVTSVTDSLAPWSSPRANKRGFPDSHGNDERPADIGQMPPGYRAAAESGGPLSPEHSRWLMGLPREWTSYAPTETRSSLLKRSSS